MVKTAAPAPSATPSISAANSASMGSGSGAASGTVTGASLIKRSNSTNNAPPGKIILNYDPESGYRYPSERGGYKFSSLKDYCFMYPYESSVGCSEPGIGSAPVFLSDWLPFKIKSLFKFGARSGMAAANSVPNFSRIFHFSGKQLGKKFSKHMSEFGLKPGQHQQYLEVARKIYNSPKAVVTQFTSGRYKGETHFVLDGNLLRLDPRGHFRSLYKLW